MKKSKSLFVLLVLALVAAAVGIGFLWNKESPVVPEAQKSLLASTGGKGYELYSWTQNGEWYYSILPATDASKTVDEVKKNPETVKGAEALGEKFRSLPQKEPVVWLRTLRENGIFAELTLPPEEELSKVLQVVTSAGWELRVDFSPSPET